MRITTLRNLFTDTQEKVIKFIQWELRRELRRKHLSDIRKNVYPIESRTFMTALCTCRIVSRTRVCFVKVNCDHDTFNNGRAWPWAYKDAECPVRAARGMLDRSSCGLLAFSRRGDLTCNDESTRNNLQSNLGKNPFLARDRKHPCLAENRIVLKTRPGAKDETTARVKYGCLLSNTPEAPIRYKIRDGKNGIVLRTARTTKTSLGSKMKNSIRSGNSSEMMGGIPFTWTYISSISFRIWSIRCSAR